MLRICLLSLLTGYVFWNPLRPVFQEQTLTDKFEEYLFKNIKYPDKPQRYGVVKTLYYTVMVHGEKSLSNFEPIDKIPKAAEDSVHELVIKATGIGEPGKLKPEYDKYFTDMVEGMAHRFGKYKKSPGQPSEVIYFSFIFEFR
jgi:hypothetical protein